MRPSWPRSKRNCTSMLSSSSHLALSPHQVALKATSPHSRVPTLALSGLRPRVSQGRTKVSTWFQCHINLLSCYQGQFNLWNAEDGAKNLFSCIYKIFIFQGVGMLTIDLSPEMDGVWLFMESIVHTIWVSKEKSLAYQKRETWFACPSPLPISLIHQKPNQGCQFG